MDLLPPGPYQLVSGYVFKRKLSAVLLALLAVAAAGVYASITIGELRELLAQRAIWKDPTAVRVPASVDGKVTTRKFLFNSYKLTAEFSDEQGGEHSRTVKFDTLLSKVDDNQEAFVIYRRGHPEEFVLSWSMSVTGGRFASFLFMFMAGVGLIGGALGFFAWTAHRQGATASAAAARGEPVWCPVTEVKDVVVNGKATGQQEFSYTLPDRVGGGTTNKITSHKKHGPPVLRQTAQGVELLAITCRSDGATLVPHRDTLHPLRFPAGQHQDLVAKAAALT